MIGSVAAIVAIGLLLGVFVIELIRMSLKDRAAAIAISAMATELNAFVERLASADQTGTPASFTAVCPCPRCGAIDCHRMRRPAPKPVPGPARVDGGIKIYQFDGMSGPDESMYEVVRICGHCNREWGQV